MLKLGGSRLLQCSDFVLGFYGLDRAKSQSEESFDTALRSVASGLDRGFGWEIANDTYAYHGIDYLPQETRNAFLQAVEKGYDSKDEAKFGKFGLNLMSSLIMDTCVSYNAKFKEPERFAEYSFKATFEKWKKIYNDDITLNPQEREEFELFCSVYQNFLDNLGTLADKAILRDNDTSTLYPPNFTAQKQMLVFEANYQFVLSQKTQQIAQEKDDILLRLLNPQDSLDIKA